MNVCAVRTLTDSHGNDEYWYVLQNYPLPHEPKSEYRYAIRAIDQVNQKIGQYVGDYAECKHCGCIYSEPKRGKK